MTRLAAALAACAAVWCWPGGRWSGSLWSGRAGWLASAGPRPPTSPLGRARGLGALVVDGWRALPLPARRRRRRRRRRAELLGVLDGLAAGLEIGLPPTTALRQAGDAAEDAAVRAVLIEAVQDPRGVGAAAVLAAAGTRDGPGGLEALALVSRAWRLSDTLGASLARSVRTVAVGAREELAARRAVATAMAEARATVVVLMALPLLGPVLAVGIGLEPGDLYGSAAGAGSAALGVGLVFVGATWMRALLGRVGRVGALPRASPSARRRRDPAP